MMPKLSTKRTINNIKKIQTKHKKNVYYFWQKHYNFIFNDKLWIRIINITFW